MNGLRLANGAAIDLERGDITTLVVDAVVNAANAYLTPGGGVSGAIHKVAGPELKTECDALALDHGPLAVGEALVTSAYGLPARKVIHALGPVWYGGGSNEEADLATTYRSVITLADSLGLKSVAFPSISTGIFGYPLELAAPVALAAVKDALGSATSVREVRFVLFEQAAYDAFADAAARLSHQGE